MLLVTVFFICPVRPSGYVPSYLVIWTHNLDTLNFHTKFTAYNRPSANGHNIGEIGAEILATNAYRYFNSRSMDSPGGYEQSVGLADDFGQGGGVSSFKV